MQKKSIREINEIYELEIPRIIRTIKKQHARQVLLQFPEAMKPYSQTIADEIESKTKCNCMIWLDSCFGACDIPVEAREIGVDMIIQFGHSEWKFGDDGIKVI